MDTALTGESKADSDALLADGTCLPNRMITIADPERCSDVPAATGLWRAQRLGQSNPALLTGAPATESPALPLPKELIGLRKFCSFVWEAGDGASPDVGALKARVGPGFGQLGNDCIVVAPLGESKTVEPKPFAIVEESARSRPKVRLAIVDSSPSSRLGLASVPPASAHGALIERYIRSQLCAEDGSGCVAELVHHLALPVAADHTEDWTAGGRVGTRWQLANAIAEATLTWLRDAPQQRLVINLSVGWESSFGGYYKIDAAELSPADHAVHSAIETAACLGALVIAAAGNDRVDPMTAEPTFPAAWETYAGPGFKECLGLITPSARFTLPMDRANADYRPLLYSAGMVPSDAPLEGSAPRLVAHAAQVQVDGFTGSSLAAAAVSAAATGIWNYDTVRAAEQVMTIVYARAVTTGFRADYPCAHELPMEQGPFVSVTCLPGVDLEIHQLSVCHAWQDLCLEHGGKDCTEATPDACPATSTVTDPKPASQAKSGSVDVGLQASALTVVPGAERLIPVYKPANPCRLCSQPYRMLAGFAPAPRSTSGSPLP